MNRSSLFSISITLMFFFSGLIGQTAAQGIRNEGATINISSGSFVVCPGGLSNNSGTITNNGTLSLSGGITNAASNTIGGDGVYNIGGNWTNNGTFTAGTNNSVTFNGTSPQTIAGSAVTTFNNLIIDDGSAGTTIAAGAMVTVAGGTFNPNGKLIVDSDALNNNGSLIYSGSGTPSGNVTYNRKLRAVNDRGERHFFSSPVGGQSIPDFILSNSNLSQIWEWDEDGPENWPLVSSGEFMSAKGYNLSQTTGSLGKFSFEGAIVTSASRTATAPYYSVATRYTDERLNWSGGGWNLLGNPFTSAMRITDEDTDGDDGNIENDFLAKNLGSFDPSYQAVYIYNGTVGDHGTYHYIAKPVSFTDPFTGDDPAFTPFASKYVQAGQGFFVLANYSGVTFSFSRAMQVHNGSVPMTKSAQAEASWPGMHLIVKNGENETYTTVIYNEKMSAGLDPGYDVGQLGSGQDVEVYTSLVEKDNSVNFARQALPLTDYDKNIIPVGIDFEKGGEVTFSAYTVPIEDKRFWLEDRVTGKFTNLNTNTYTVTLPSKSYGTGRFFILASANTPTGISDLTGADGLGLRIWTSDDKVIIKGAVNDGALCEIYDTGGRKVLMIRLTDGDLNTVALPSDSHGVFLVRVIDAEKVTTRKVAVL